MNIGGAFLYYLEHYLINWYLILSIGIWFLPYVFMEDKPFFLDALCYHKKCRECLVYLLWPCFLLGVCFLFSWFVLYPLEREMPFGHVSYIYLKCLLALLGYHQLVLFGIWYLLRRYLFPLILIVGALIPISLF